MRKKKMVSYDYAPPVQEQYNPNVQVCSFSPRPITPNVVTALPNSANYSANTQGEIIGLPKYVATDEYGRVFRVNTTYGPQPCSGPVPIPTPCGIVQTAPIVAPTPTNRR